MSGKASLAILVITVMFMVGCSDGIPFISPTPTSTPIPTPTPQQFSVGVWTVKPGRAISNNLFTISCKGPRPLLSIRRLNTRWIQPDEVQVTVFVKRNDGTLTFESEELTQSAHAQVTWFRLHDAERLIAGLATGDLVSVNIKEWGELSSIKGATVELTGLAEALNSLSCVSP